MAVSVAGVVAAVAIVTGLSCRAGLILALPAAAVVPLGVPQLSPVVSSDIVCSSAGLN